MMTNRWIVVTALCGLLAVGACGGGGSGPAPTATQPTPDDPRPTQPTSDPAQQLRTARFTTHQPRVLEQIGAHHAYARGLTGRGVRIAIDDTIVDYTQTAEFGSRVKLRDADGAELSYSHPFGDRSSSEAGACRQNPSCQLWEGDGEGDDEARNRWVRDIVSQDGWPTRDDSVYFVDEHYSKTDPLLSLFRWREVPTPYGFPGSHGTAVASVAAGTNLGVAPEATIIPIAKNLTPDDQQVDAAVERALKRAIQELPLALRQQLDNLVAQGERNSYANFDIINRSFGSRLSELNVIASVNEVEWFRFYLPKTLNAVWQTGTPDAQKTIFVYAAGNDGGPAPGLGAFLPYVFPELRGHSLAVAATDPRTRAIASYSNRCGPLPSDWSAARDGPHYCLTAPGTARGLVPNPNSPGRGYAGYVDGTSIAAPVVSGSLALLMEHFRGTRGNTAIVRRMLDTADRSGRYADLATYGAGHLDLEAALSPVGTLSVGRSAQALSRTTLQVPAAFGSVAARVEDIEIASFDEQDFPFWVPMTALVSTRPTGRSPIPQLEGPGGDTPLIDPNALGLHGMPVAGDGSLWLADEHGWVTGFGPSSATLARLPHDGRWGYGLSVDDAGYLGAQTSGAFGSDPRSGMVWASRAFQHDLDAGWSLDVVGTVAVGVPQYEDDAIFQASPSVLSAMSMRVGTDGWGLTLEQPLRAESGTGTFRIENGHMESGQRLYDEYRIPLEPEARETRVTLRHEREALGGDVALMVSGAANAGHVSGEREMSMGLAYRTNW